MSKHTPGPWRSRIITSAPHARWITGADNIVISPRIEYPEDAALIAAAPDLLAALEAASRMLAEYNAGRLNYPTTTPEVLAESRAAIAKARGESSK